ncbi:acetyltransferase [Azospirillum soli]|uniref:acetyltransferase n=1 Tax=Azospirillum soli TaxID=1304799 RepID=UPI001AE73AB7|nr:acetyltransferase [Azospirillum soli]MBP2316253.1 sugar O-acyltransferase (sialic acid O-acetyltransferase NeuD family) [Azospirillum soli]
MRIVIFGAGGHAKVVCDVIEAFGGFTVAGFVTPDPEAATYLGYPLHREETFLRTGPAIDAAAIAIGDNAVRWRVAAQIRTALPKIAFPALVHPTAVISSRAILSEGSIVMARAVVNAAALVGRFAIVNTGAILEHDSRLGDGAHLAPGSVVGGAGQIGDGCLVGIGATVRPGVRMAAGSVLGAGAVAVSHLEEMAVFVGVPAVRMKQRNQTRTIAPED